jgi:ribosomal protein S18 acetylase RimI-like enzyme
MELKYTFLTEKHFPQIFSTFMEAFADYYVNASYMTEEVLFNRAVKNAVDYDSCVGVFAEEKMVGFTLIGIDHWQDKLAAFDAGTGIIPAYRGKGIAKKMFDFAVPQLEQRGVKKFLLEVLQVNEPAVKAYKKAGFNITRELDCYRLHIDKLTAARHAQVSIEINKAGKEILHSFETELDWQPSWENSFASIERIPDDIDIYCATVNHMNAGLLVYYPTLNWTMSIVVRKDYRRKGIANCLLAHFVQNLAQNTPFVKLINADHADLGLRAFLEKTGFCFDINQFEMELNL